MDLDLVRDPETGKSKGFAFAAFEDQRSTVLAVDNLNGVPLLGRHLLVDHVAEYRGPRKRRPQSPNKNGHGPTTASDPMEDIQRRRRHILPDHLQQRGSEEEGNVRSGFWFLFFYLVLTHHPS